MMVKAGHNNAEPWEVGIEERGVRLQVRTFSSRPQAQAYYDQCQKQAKEINK
jgi:hypothetical protein